MTTSSGSRSPRSSAMPRSATEARLRRAARLVWPIALVGAVIGAATLIAGDDRDDEPPSGSQEFRGPLDLGSRELISYVKQGFRGRTDFTRRAVPLAEFVPAGPPRNGIPSINDPAFVSVREANRFLDAREPVAVVELGGEVRAYPLQIMVWHEIVNDEIAGEPVAVTYCPLCNSTVVFRREVAGRELRFGTTGVIRNSDLVMYDRQTFSWWQQLTGEAIVGELTGKRLHVHGSQILAWRVLRRAHPRARVLARPTDSRRPYGRTPYVGYEESNDPYLFRGQPAPGLPATERVVAVRPGGQSTVVYPFSRLRREAPVNDVVDGRPIAVFFDPQVRSALDRPRIADGANVGAAGVFSAQLGGRRLTFSSTSDPGRARDRETGSVWDLSGRAVAGPLEGTQLEQVRHDDQFWFALAAFYPKAEIRG